MLVILVILVNFVILVNLVNLVILVILVNLVLLVILVILSFLVILVNLVILVPWGGSWENNICRPSVFFFFCVDLFFFCKLGPI